MSTPAPPDDPSEREREAKLKRKLFEEYWRGRSAGARTLGLEEIEEGVFRFAPPTEPQVERNPVLVRQSNAAGWITTALQSVTLVTKSN